MQVLQIAHANRLSQFGTLSLDGTKIHANASRHSALSYGHAEKIETQLRQEVQQLLALAEQSDQGDVPDGMNVPEEIARRSSAKWMRGGIAAIPNDEASNGRSLGRMRTRKWLIIMFRN